MKSTRRVFRLFPLWAFSLSLSLLLLPCPIYAQEFPTKAITLYCGYDAGAGTDITARALAAEAEKILGAPIVVENKPGGGSTVCAALVASKKGDGYTLGLGSSQVITASPHLMTLSYNPLKDFTPVMQYSYYVSGLVVLSESPSGLFKISLPMPKPTRGCLTGAQACTASPTSPRPSSPNARGSS
jgi:tripartite-type tricarboxylate transporter receptor subunit TctC